jgi:hypothetical protein
MKHFTRYGVFFLSISFSVMTCTLYSFLLYIHLRLTTCDQNMTIKLEPEMGVPVYDDDPTVDLSVRARAARVTAEELGEHGLDLTPTDEDEAVASMLSMSYAQDPEKASKKATKARVATLTPASLVLTSNILTEFGHSVVESSIHVRHLVTNKLILETENPDARVRMRALELLGKISDVGLFAEKSEMTVTHQSTDDLKAKLRQKLEKLVNPPNASDDPIVLDGEFYDVNEALGTKPKKGAKKGAKSTKSPQKGGKTVEMTDE